jgi:hypothetical protein
MRDDQVIDGTAFYDSIAFNDLWARDVGVRRPGSCGECSPELGEVSYSVRKRMQLQSHVQLECPVRRLPVVP